MEEHMTDEKPILKDPDQYPTEDVIYACIGKKKTLWVAYQGQLTITITIWISVPTAFIQEIKRF